MTDFVVSWALYVWTLVSTVAVEIGMIFYDSAFYILLGFFVAGLLHEFVPGGLIVRHLGGNNIRSIVLAAIIGAPMPLCSCSVLPTAMALRRRGASKPAVASFLISVPETDVENLAITYGLLGPVMAVYRPIAGVTTAICAGLLTMLFGEKEAGSVQAAVAAAQTHKHGHAHDHAHGHTHSHDDGDACCAPAEKVVAEPHDHHHDHHHGHDHSHDDFEGGRAVDAPFGARMANALDYGYVRLLDEIAFWITFGLVLTGVLIGLLPENFFSMVGLDSGIVPMLMMILISVPIYTCASMSTPVGAGLIATGLSPGAALVYLLCGPATSMATLPIIGRLLGARLLAAYLIALIGVALIAGLVLDYFFADMVRNAVVAGRAEPDTTFWVVVKTASMVAFVLMLVASFRRGSFRIGYADFTGNMGHFRTLRNYARLDWRGGLARCVDAIDAVGGTGVARWMRAADWARVNRLAQRGALAAVAAAAVAYVTPAFVLVVDVGQAGMIQRFGRVVERDLAPGLYFHLPAPLGRGVTVNAALVDQISVDSLKENVGGLDDEASTMLSRNYYLTSDENVIDIQAAIQVRVSDPYRAAFVNDDAENVIRAIGYQILVSMAMEMPIDRIYSVGRHALEDNFQRALKERVAARDLGYEVVAARLTYVHAPGGVHDAFRDVSSAIEDRARSIFEANGNAAVQLSQSRGRAATVSETAAADSIRSVKGAEGRALPFTSLAEVHDRAPSLTERRLLFETVERSLRAPQKYINGANLPGSQIDLWIGAGASRAGQLPAPLPGALSGQTAAPLSTQIPASTP